MRAVLGVEAELEVQRMWNGVGEEGGDGETKKIVGCSNQI